MITGLLIFSRTKDNIIEFFVGSIDNIVDQFDDDQAWNTDNSDCVPTTMSYDLREKVHVLELVHDNYVYNFWNIIISPKD